MRTIFYFLLIAIACSCKSKNIEKEVYSPKPETVKKELDRTAKLIAYNDSLNKSLQWKQVEDDLYINKGGELGIRAFRLLEPPDDGYVYYQTCLRDEKNTPLNKVVDAKTYKRIGGGGYGAFYKDKKHIYHTFGTSGGTNFSVVEESDYATFKIIDDCCAKDKNHVYDMRDGLREDIDVNTFKVLEIDNRCYAKDKNGYYEGTRKFSDEQLKDPEMQKIIKKLDKL